MDDETRAYLDAPWRVTEFPTGLRIICGDDGDGIITLEYWNAAHLLTPADVAEYIQMLHQYYLMRRTEAE